jgi:hypothetical protein
MTDDRIKPVDAPIESVEAAKEELKTYCGTPKCCDCKWKLGSPLTDYCGCRGEKGYNRELFDAAMARARALQNFIIEHAGVDAYYEAIGG